MAELIRLDRPPADFCLSVSGVSPTLEIPKLEKYLRELAGGPLWSLIVHEDNGSGRRRWAMAFFYCKSVWLKVPKAQERTATGRPAISIR